MEYRDKYDVWFDNLYRQYYKKLFLIAARRILDNRKAEELTHDVFELLWKKSRDKNLMSHPNIGGWLVQSLEFFIQNEVRASEFRRELPLSGALETVQAFITYQEPLSEVLPDGLTAEERKLLIWCYDDGLPYSEIADRLGIFQSLCRMRMSRARHKFKKMRKKKKYSETMLQNVCLNT